MPFDGTPTKPDLSVPTLEGLIWLLDHPEEWPEGFEFWWPDCRTCAMGLLWRKYPGTVERPDVPWVGPALGLSEEDAIQLFCTTPAHARVTPGRMAALLRQYLATGNVSADTCLARAA